MLTRVGRPQTGLAPTSGSLPSSAGCPNRRSVGWDGVVRLDDSLERCSHRFAGGFRYCMVCSTPLRPAAGALERAVAVFRRDVFCGVCGRGGISPSVGEARSGDLLLEKCNNGHLTRSCRPESLEVHMIELEATRRASARLSRASRAE